MPTTRNPVKVLTRTNAIAWIRENAPGGLLPRVAGAYTEFNITTKGRYILYLAESGNYVLEDRTGIA